MSRMNWVDQLISLYNAIEEKTATNRGFLHGGHQNAQDKAANEAEK